VSPTEKIVFTFLCVAMLVGSLFFAKGIRSSFKAYEQELQLMQAQKQAAQKKYYAEAPVISFLKGRIVSNGVISSTDKLEGSYSGSGRYSRHGRIKLDAESEPIVYVKLQDGKVLQVKLWEQETESISSYKFNKNETVFVRYWHKPSYPDSAVYTLIAPPKKISARCKNSG